MAYATIDDYKKRFGEPADKARCEQLLQDASTLIDAFTGKAEEGFEGKFPPAYTVVCCEVAHRAIATPAELLGVNNYTKSAVGYSETFGYSNPNGDLFLSSTQKRMLGVGKARIGALRPEVHRSACPPESEVWR